MNYNFFIENLKRLRLMSGNSSRNVICCCLMTLHKTNWFEKLFQTSHKLSLINLKN